MTDDTTSTPYSAAYSYFDNFSLVDHIDFAKSGSTVVTTKEMWDCLNRLTNIITTNGASAVSSSAYRYNQANQRTNVTTADSSYWVYQYDSLGQVQSGRNHWSDGTPPVCLA